MMQTAPRGRSLSELYGTDSAEIARHARRWEKLLSDFRLNFGDREVRLFSSPGRTEIGGNHTDHNHGKVLAAAIDLDSIAVAAVCPENRIKIYSEGYNRPFVVALDYLSPVREERGTTTALIRGIVSRFRQLGHAAGGFEACIASDVPVGSGLSSSASIEVLIATVLNALYNSNAIEAKQIALIGEYAENVFFGKPCGLMDQITCAVGGIVRIDFEDPESPAVDKINFNFAAHGYSVMVVDTRGSHADLTEDYASIPREMKLVASQFGLAVCRQIREHEILHGLAELRSKVGDRAILRALHFLQENERVELLVGAMQDKDVERFLKLITESGNSSFKWLQNCIPPPTQKEQGIPLALALAEKFVQSHGGACRVHGGGFAGTVLVFLRFDHTEEFRSLMESAFGPGCARTLRVRPQGSLEVR